MDRDVACNVSTNGDADVDRDVACNVSTTGNVFINATQHFTRVPAKAWEFYIGGYQPAQKWLKDRKGRTLTFDDIQHYRRIIAALSETDRPMGRYLCCQH